MRKKRSLLNIITSLGSYFSIMILTFLVQSAIVKILGIEYSGINGLFTNIVTMLSIAELGMGTTVIYKLYQPIASNDKEEIKKWVKFYKTCYSFVSILVVILGLLVLPFIPMIVGETNVKENVYILYLLVLFDTVSSYILAYKRSLLYADQKNYVINFVHIFYVCFLNLTQILLLLLTENYYLFIIIKPLFQVLENIILSLYVNKKYPYIKEKAEKIDKTEKKDFMRRIFAMFIQKISFVVNKGTDNILISLFFGIANVGYYTNYNLIATTICGVIYQIISGFGASVGSLLTDKNTEKSFKVFRRIEFLNYFFTGFGVVGYVCCIQPFISLWLGEDYLQSLAIVASFGLYIFSDSFRRSITIFKEAAGICKEDERMYIYMALINIIASISLANIMGVAGVIVGTAISYLFLILYSYPKYIFAPIFKMRKKVYYRIVCWQLLTIIIVSFLISYMVSLIHIENSLLCFVISILIASVAYSVLFLVFNCRNEELKYFISLAKKRFAKKPKSNTVLPMKTIKKDDCNN